MTNSWLSSHVLFKDRSQFELTRTGERRKKQNPNAHTYVNGTDVETHGFAVTQNTFLQQFI